VPIDGGSVPHNTKKNVPNQTREKVGRGKKPNEVNVGSGKTPEVAIAVGPRAATCSLKVRKRGRAEKGVKDTAAVPGRGDLESRKKEPPSRNFGAHCRKRKRCCGKKKKVYS